MKQLNIIVFDIETTGLNKDLDEILQISIINGNGETLLNEYVKPVNIRHWPEAEKIHHITPDMVKDAKTFKELKKEVQKIFNNAELLISYNGQFDKYFLRREGVIIPSNKDNIDVMLDFAKEYGELDPVKKGYKWHKLTFAADYYKYNYNAHDALDDVKATLYIAEQLYGANLKKISFKTLIKRCWRSIKKVLLILLVSFILALSLLILVKGK